MRAGASVRFGLVVVVTTSCMKQYAGDLARAGDVPGCARVLEEEENFTRAAAREKCEFIAGFTPDEYPEDVHEREREVERRVATKGQEATTPSVGRVVKRSHMGKASYAAETPPDEDTDDPGIAEVGVPECDFYIEKYLECIERVPAEARREIRKAIAHSADAWRQAASGPAADTLAPACAEATKAVKEATREMGCTWD